MKKGFTLLEILVTISVLATVITLIVQVFLTTTRANTKNNLLYTIGRDGSFALDIMERLIRGAQDITMTCDIGATTTPSASLVGRDGSVTHMTCYGDGVSARIASISAQGSVQFISGTTGTLSSSGQVTCDDSSLVFSCPEASGIDGPVTISFTLTQVGEGGSPVDRASMTFEATAGKR